MSTEEAPDAVSSRPETMIRSNWAEPFIQDFLADVLKLSKATTTVQETLPDLTLEDKQNNILRTYSNPAATELLTSLTRAEGWKIGRGFDYTVAVPFMEVGERARCMSFSRPDGKLRFYRKKESTSLDSRLSRSVLECNLGKIRVPDETIKDRLDKLKTTIQEVDRKAIERGVSRAELEKCYRQISRLVTATPAKLPLSERIKIAIQALKNVADPGRIDQGQKNTCNVAAVEVNMYNRDPSKALKLVTDIATRGSFVTKDGTRIKVDPKDLVADKEGRNLFTRNGERSHASQLFQIAAINVFWQRHSDATTTKGSLKYISHHPKMYKDDYGQRIINTKTGKPLTFVSDKGEREHVRDPKLDVDAFGSIYRQIAGKRPETLAIGYRDYMTTAPGARSFKTEQELHSILKGLSERKQLPIIIKVHIGQEPFNAIKPGDKDYDSAWHVVNITGYNPRTGMAKMDNTWGKHNDKTVSLKTLFKACNPPDLRRRKY